MKSSPGYEISTDKRRLDLGVIYRFLHSSYWAKDRSRRLIEKSIEHSLCFGAYQGKRQVGFARVVTDFAVFAYLADVFVLPGHRGRGVARKLLKTILAHPQLQGIKTFQLATRDAHALYAEFGFKPLADPERQMKRIKPGLKKARGSRVIRR